MLGIVWNWRNRAFTLIELLIVVAVIAILAEIAVPNFLEAQVRSKVSRVHADLRSMACAIELYMVDHNLTPLGRSAYNDLTGKSGWLAYNLLTTPIAYMTRPVRDPFIETANAVSKDFQRDSYGGVAYRYYNYQTAYPYSGLALSGEEKTAWRIGYTWFANSLGPARRNATPGVWAMLVGTKTPANVYDPTNGTTSWGYIIRTNKGIGLAGSKQP